MYALYMCLCMCVCMCDHESAFLYVRVFMRTWCVRTNVNMYVSICLVIFNC